MARPSPLKPQPAAQHTALQVPQSNGGVARGAPPSPASAAAAVTSGTQGHDERSLAVLLKSLQSCSKGDTKPRQAPHAPQQRSPKRAQGSPRKGGGVQKQVKRPIKPRSKAPPEKGAAVGGAHVTSGLIDLTSCTACGNATEPSANFTCIGKKATATASAPVVASRCVLRPEQ